MGGTAMNWMSLNWILALPEIVLSCCGMAILILGVGYSGLFVTDAYSAFVKLLVLAAAALGVVMSLDYNEHENLSRFEFPVLILFSTVGMMLMASATSLMTMYMGVELMSLSIYVLAAFARDELRSSEAGLSISCSARWPRA
jgi:NADH-quinone oxidoreductase subunit N